MSRETGNGDSAAWIGDGRLSGVDFHSAGRLGGRRNENPAPNLSGWNGEYPASCRAARPMKSGRALFADLEFIPVEHLSANLWEAPSNQMPALISRQFFVKFE